MTSSRVVRICLYFTCILIATAWLLMPEYFISDDSYFYLTIGRKLALLGEQTFSEVYPTNGFHPLWGYLLAGYSLLVSALGADSLLYVERTFLPLSLGIVGVGILLHRLTFPDPWQEVGLIALISFFGGFGLLYSEGHLLFLVLTVVFSAGLRLRDGGRWDYFIFGVVLGILFLTRLDMVFVGASCIVGVAVLDGRKEAIYTSVGCLLVTVPYVTSNYLVFGEISPISGALKSSFPVPQLTGFSYNGGANLTLSGMSVPFGLAPALVALAGMRWGEFSTQITRKFFLLVLLGVYGQLIYIMVFGAWATEWYWYYVPAVYVGSIGLGSLLVSMNAEGNYNIFGVLSVAITIGLVGLLSIRLVGSPLTMDKKVTADFVAGHNIGSRESVIISDAPGYVGFKSDAAIVATDLLTSNPRVYERIKNSENGLSCLIHLASDGRHKAQWLLYVVEGSLVFNEAENRLIYPDPDVSDDIIGQLKLGPPDFRSQTGNVLGWKINKLAGKCSL